MRATTCRTAAAWLIVLLLGGLSTPPPARAADPPATRPAEPAAIREQTVYIPYTKLRDVFEKEGRGVFLPYERFLELWRGAQERAAPPPDRAAPPADALISEVDSEASVRRDVVEVESRVRIELLKPGWLSVPLRLSDAAITGSAIGNEPARIVFTPGAGHSLLIHKTGTEPESIELRLTYAKSYERAPGQNSVTFEPPQAPVSRWRLRVPESGVKVSVEPMLAATEVPQTQPAQAEETVVLAFVGAAPRVRIAWTPKAEGATGLEAVAAVRAEQQVVIDEGVVRSRVELTYQISRSELSALSLTAPADWRVVEVADANVRQWAARPAGEGRQEITVQLFQPARESQSLSIELEKFTGDEPRQTIAAPVVSAGGVGRQQGVVAVRVAPSLRAEVTRQSGVIQLDASELPQGLGSGKWEFAYRYAALPYALELAVEKLQPRVIADWLVEAQLEPEELTLRALAVMDVQRAGVFRFNIDLPEGFEVRQVRGEALAGATAAEVEGFHAEGEGATRLVINLARKAMGKTGLLIELSRKLQSPDLLAPTGEAAQLTLSPPRAANVERQTGKLLLHAPESLTLAPDKTDGLRPISLNEATAHMQSWGRPVPSGRTVLTFGYGTQPASLSLSARRRPPYVVVRQLLVARIDPGVVKYEATFYYDIRYSGVRTLRIDVPSDLAGSIRNQTPNVREAAITPPPPDVAEGYTAWSFTGDAEFTGSPTLRLTWEQKIDRLGLGESAELSIPELRPRDTDRAWGQIVLAKAETIDVRESGDPAGLRPIDPQHDLMPAPGDAALSGAARAFEFHEPWRLTVTAAQYKLEEVKRTSIERGVMRAVVTRGQETAVQALYRVRSAQQRLPIELPAGVKFDAQPARINGRSVTLERDDKGRFFVPLTQQSPDTPFLLDLRYSTAGTAGRIEPPSFPDDAAIQKVYLAVYLPEDRRVLGSRGPWSREMDWRLDDDLRWKTWSRRDVPGLLAWTGEGIDLGGGAGAAGEGFQTDGTLHLFSSTGSVPPPGSALRLTTIGSRALSAWVLGIILVGGVWLLRASARGRWLAVGLLFALIVLSGVFLPTFALQVLDGVTAAAVALVLMLWLLHYVLWVRPRDPLVQARRRAREEAIAAAVTPLRPVPAGPAPPPIPPPPGTPENPGPPANRERGE